MFSLAIAFCLSPEPRQIVPYPAVVPLDGKRFSLRLHVFVVGNKFTIALPVIRAETVDFHIFNLFPELYSCFC